MRREDRLLDGGWARGVEAAQQEGAFHLGAGDRHRVFDALQCFALDERRDRNRWVELVGLLARGARDVRAPRPQWLDHAAHRTPRQGFVARHARAESLSAQQARQQSHRRAGVAAVDDVGGHAKPLQPYAVDGGGVVCAFDGDAHRAERLSRRCVVQALRQARDARHAASERAEDQTSVADRFVPWNSNAAVQRARSANTVSLLRCARHATPLARARANGESARSPRACRR
jgi:hypothetical protein